MGDGIDIRESVPGDLAALEALYPAAFPGEDLLPLVRDIEAAGAGVLSLVAVDGGEIVGHVAFTHCSIVGRGERLELLAPLAVAPARQGRGIGGALIREGLRRLAETGAVQVLVLGDPAYYGRFGFVADGGAVPPHPLPEDWSDAWQALRLREFEPPLAGRLDLPAFWLHPALWAP